MMEGTPSTHKPGLICQIVAATDATFHSSEVSAYYLPQTESKLLSLHDFKSRNLALLYGQIFIW